MLSYQIMSGLTPCLLFDCSWSMNSVRLVFKNYQLRRVHCHGIPSTSIIPWNKHSCHCIWGSSTGHHPDIWERFFYENNLKPSLTRRHKLNSDRPSYPHIPRTQAGENLSIAKRQIFLATTLPFNSVQLPTTHDCLSFWQVLHEQLWLFTKESCILLNYFIRALLSGLIWIIIMGSWRRIHSKYQLVPRQKVSAKWGFSSWDMSVLLIPFFKF